MLGKGKVVIYKGTDIDNFDCIKIIDLNSITDITMTNDYEFIITYTGGVFKYKIYENEDEDVLRHFIKSLLSNDDYDHIKEYKLSLKRSF